MITAAEWNDSYCVCVTYSPLDHNLTYKKETRCVNMVLFLRDPWTLADGICVLYALGVQIFLEDLVLHQSHQVLATHSAWVQLINSEFKVDPVGKLIEEFLALE